MCKSFRNNCKGCGINKLRNGGEGCLSIIKNYPEGAVAIVEKWSAEHLVTRQSEFLKMFPNVERLPDGCIALCLHKLDLTFNLANCSTSRCGECKRGFWLAEVE